MSTQRVNIGIPSRLTVSASQWTYPSYDAVWLLVWRFGELRSFDLPSFTLSLCEDWDLEFTRC